MAAAADTVGSMARWPLARVCFSSGEVEDVDLYNALTLLQFRGLPLPESGLGREEYTDSNRIAVAIMHSMSALAARVINVGTPEDMKLIVYDDALPILQSAQGRATLERDVLRGRSLSCVNMVISQNASHVLSGGEDTTLVSNFGAVIVFRLPDQREAEAGCRALGIPPDEDHIRILRSLGPDPSEDEPAQWTECVMRDNDGHVGRVQPQLYTQALRDAFNTTPGRRYGLHVVDEAASA